MIADASAGARSFPFRLLFRVLFAQHVGPIGIEKTKRALSRRELLKMGAAIVVAVLVCLAGEVCGSAGECVEGAQISILRPIPGEVVEEAAPVG